ncbi:MAG: molybdopterin-dependent oxidoreductase [Deltaproteobacteria bacterium]|nr:molybdopterin-dependent oxidoreductase [Deltaproteobacteria bacterium]
MEILTACTLDCPDGCSLLVETLGQGTVRIRGNPNHPVTAGFTCAKIRRFSQRLKSKHRITSPLLRQGKSWKSIGWEEALELCAEKIQRHRREPESILHLRGDGDKGVLSQASKLFFAELGASQAAGSLCDVAGTAACIADFGSLETNDVLDLASASTIINWGKDLARSSNHLAALVRKARQEGARVLSISPGGDGNLGYSDRVIIVRPGTDRFLAMAVVQLLLKRGKIPREIIKRTKNWTGFQKLVMARPVRELTRGCDISEDVVEELFRVYGGSEPVATLLGWGLQRYKYGGETVRFINALALLSGHIGRPGGGCYFNISSTRDFNLNWTKAADGMKRRTLLEPRIGKDILEAKDPPVRLLWVNGFNVVNQAPDSVAIAKAFETIQFKVAVEAFMTDTAARSDLILPCQLMFEKEDVVGSFLHNYVHYVRPVVKPPEGARSDFVILSELGKRLSPPIQIPPAEACMRASLDSPYLGISLTKLRQLGFIRARRPEIAYAGLKFDHPDGKYHLPREIHQEISPDADFPLRLLTLVRRNFLHSQILPEEHVPVPSVWISEENMIVRGLDPDKDIYMVSPLGRLKVRIKYDRGLHPQVVIYRRGDWMSLGGGANQLIEAELTDLGGGAAYYSQFVRLEN